MATILEEMIDLFEKAKTHKDKDGGDHSPFKGYKMKESGRLMQVLAEKYRQLPDSEASAFVALMVATGAADYREMGVMIELAGLQESRAQKRAVLLALAPAGNPEERQYLEERKKDIELGYRAARDQILVRWSSRHAP